MYDLSTGHTLYVVGYAHLDTEWRWDYPTTIREYILSPEKTLLIRNAIGEGVTQYGMQTFDQSLLSLLRENLIGEEEALRNSTNPNELALKLKGISATSDRMWQPVDAATGDGEEKGLGGLWEYLKEQLGKADAGKRRQFGRLEHHAVTRCKRWSDFPRGHQQRVVPR